MTTSATKCRGLPADWLNAWLAAIGITAVVPNLRLAWTREPASVAVFHGVEGIEQLAHAVAERLPTEEQISDCSVATQLADSECVVRRNFDVDCYSDRAKAERARRGWQLAASASDLVQLDGPRAAVPHSPFDPAAPGTTGGVFDRLIKCYRRLPNDTGQLADRIENSLQGTAVRDSCNGLGFDVRRLEIGVGVADKTVDIVVECLAYQALRLFPARGNGDKRGVLTRGWSTSASRSGAFRWPVWSAALDTWAIDGLLDRFFDALDRTPGSNAPRGLRTWGVRGAFESVPYRTESAADPTRAYGSRPVRWNTNL